MEEQIKDTEAFEELNPLEEEIQDYEMQPVEDEVDLIESNPLEDQEEVKQSNSSWNFDEYLAKRLELEDGKFYTGSEDNPVEKSISELNEQQKVALLEEYYRSQLNQPQDSGVSNEEQVVLNYLREGDLEGLYSELSRELGVNTQQQDYVEPSDDDLIYWKVKSDNPDFDDDEIQEEIELIKESPKLEQKINSYKKQYRNAVEAYRAQQEQQEFAQLDNEYRQLQDNIIEIVRNTNEIAGFELDEEDDDVKNEVLADLLEYNEGSNLPRFMEYINTPEGMVETALTVKSLPKIYQYIESLHQKIEEMENGKESYVGNTIDQERNDDYDGPDPLGIGRN